MARPNPSDSRPDAQTLRVAAVQMVSTADLEHNLARAGHWLSEAAQQAVEVALLPENFVCFNSKGFLDIARQEAQQQHLQHQLANWAREYNLWIVAGTLPLLAEVPERVKAASLVFSPAGECVARYDKIHLFDVEVADAQGAYQESAILAPGQHTVVADLGKARFGLSVCYDIRFPGLYQGLRATGAEFLTVPAAFTWVTGEAHWEALLRARAIETQCFVVAANQGGQHNPQRRTWGHSMIIDPWGRILAQSEEGEALVVADCDLNQLADVRRLMPVFAHRVPGVSC